MAENSQISWTDNTWNPWIGCTKVSDGCKFCYAERDFDKRRHVVEWGPGKPRKRTTEAYWKQPLAWNRKAEKDGTRPRVFCASLADWLDPEVPIEWLADLLELISATPHLDWLLLTKRPELWWERVEAALHFLLCSNPTLSPLEFLARVWLDGYVPNNIWIGTTVENQKATARIPHLLQIPGLVHFLSCEPLIGAVDLSPWLYLMKERGEAWVICGGESGPNARPMRPAWARSLRDQCVEAQIPFHFKQWGEWAPGECAQDAPTKTERTATWFDDKWIFEQVSVKSSEEMHCDDEPDLYRLGKKDAGRLLDGREWNELPKAQRP